MVNESHWSLVRRFSAEYHEIPGEDQGRLQDFFQRVAEISSGGGKNLPGGGEKNLAALPSSQRFFAFLHTILLIYGHFFFTFF